jgi:hypothetical protein
MAAVTMVSMIAVFIFLAVAIGMFAFVAEHYRSKYRDMLYSAVPIQFSNVENTVARARLNQDERPSEDIGPDLIEHLNWTLSHTPAEERKGSRWVMDGTWYSDLRAASLNGHSFWEPPRNVNGDFLVFGLPVLIRPGGGPPHLESLPPGTEASPEPDPYKETIACSDRAITAGYGIPASLLPNAVITMNEARSEDDIKKIRDMTVREWAEYKKSGNASKVMVLPEGAQYMAIGSPEESVTLQTTNEPLDPRNKYEKYIEGVGLIRCSTPEKLARAVEVVTTYPQERWLVKKGRGVDDSDGYSVR